jgi:hypothetical protein
MVTNMSETESSHDQHFVYKKPVLSRHSMQVAPQGFEVQRRLSDNPY